MISGPDPGALPMISRIGLSGNAACAACAAGAAISAERTIAAIRFAVCMWNLLTADLCVDICVDANIAAGKTTGTGGGAQSDARRRLRGTMTVPPTAKHRRRNRSHV
jgi:hypothetical protein